MESPTYPVSTSVFETIRTENFVYVDKTDYVYSLVRKPGYFFLGRPRRFGKSLLLSTIEAYFMGKRDLFRGLAIDRLQPGDWETYPVIHLDMSGKTYLKDEDLYSLLDMHLSNLEGLYGITDHRESPDERFYMLIETVTKVTGKKVVVLIDEYDSPLSDTIDSPELQEIYREQLHGFYSVLKKAERNIRFCMLTGVTKFGKVSVFSGLNNLKDISFSNEYAGICGITEEELHSSSYEAGVRKLARNNGWDPDEAFRQLKVCYDGYHFSKSMLDVYNPYSINNALFDGEISDYWCRSGLPTLLSKTLMDSNFVISSLNGSMVEESTLSDLSVYRTDPVPLLYQTGYLTLKSYDAGSQLYTIGYPNREVERGILGNILQVYMSGTSNVKGAVALIRQDLAKGEPMEAVGKLKAFLSGIPSRLRTNVSRYENYYHTIFYCIASLIGLDTDVEYNTSEGFIDMTIKTDRFIYVIELKVNGDAEDAIRQIEEKHYAAPFATDHRRLFKVGLGFSRKTATIQTVIIE